MLQKTAQFELKLLITHFRYHLNFSAPINSNNNGNELRLVLSETELFFVTFKKGEKNFTRSGRPCTILSSPLSEALELLSIRESVASLI